MLIYKICTQEAWQEMQRSGFFPPMPIDVADGYIHLSTAEQRDETAKKYFAGQHGLVLLTVDSEALSDGLRWEPSSSGTRLGNFPHLYGQLMLSAIVSAEPFFVSV